MNTIKFLFARFGFVLPLILSLVTLLDVERAGMQAEPEPTGTAAPAVTIPVTASGKWQVGSITDASQGLIFVTLALDAEIIQNPALDDPVQTRLLLQCDQQELGVSIQTNSGLSLDIDTHTVLLKFDTLPAKSAEMQFHADGYTMTFLDPAEIVRAMNDHEFLVMTYSTSENDVVEANFDLRGLSDIINQLWQVCPNPTLQESRRTPNAIVSDPRDTTINDEDGIELGNVVMTEAVDRNNCATTPVTTFDADIERVYVVAEASEVAEGTAVFVRWYRDGEVYEDAPEITADQDYENTCISFSLEVDNANGFRAGSYEAEFIINGNPADKVAFEMQ